MLAIAISVVAALISAASAAWNIYSWRMSGSKLEVDEIEYIKTDVRTPSFQVVNAGRTPVSVVGIVIDAQHPLNGSRVKFHLPFIGYELRDVEIGGAMTPIFKVPSIQIEPGGAQVVTTWASMIVQACVEKPARPEGLKVSFSTGRGEHELPISDEFKAAVLNDWRVKANG